MFLNYLYLLFYYNRAEKFSKSPIKPKAVPAITKIAVIKRFSLRFLFTLYNIRRPTPAPEKRPESIVPTVIIPSTHRFVRVTDTAQFGIRPMTDAITWLIIGLSYMILEIFSLPTNKISAFIVKVIMRINPPIVRVW